jgi:hypothetical protein
VIKERPIILKERPIICHRAYIKEVSTVEGLSGERVQDSLNNVIIEWARETVVFVGLCSLHLWIADKIETEPAAKRFNAVDFLRFKRASLDEESKGAPTPYCPNMLGGMFHTHGLKGLTRQGYQPYFVSGWGQQVLGYCQNSSRCESTDIGLEGIQRKSIILRKAIKELP